MLFFTIALRGKHSTSHWDDVVAKFNATLHSVFNQTSPEFQVYVGCNEIPELYEKYDERLHFVTVNTAKPSSWEEGCRDRMWKLLRCAQEIRTDYLNAHPEGAFVFPVDADDYVNCRIAQYVQDHPDANGFKSKDGYRYVCGQNHMTITPWYGGTMNIMKLYPDDMPETLPDVSTCFQQPVAAQLTQRYPICWYDIEAKRQFAAIGRPFQDLPFRSTIYVIGTGDNLSVHDPSRAGKRDQFHPVAFLRKLNPMDKRLLTKKLKREFGME